jgi:hypothetical protein
MLNFSKFQGRKLSLFVENIERVTSFLEGKLVITTNEIEQFLKGMRLLTPLFKFMSTTCINTDESYIHALALFKTIPGISWE